MTIRAALFDLGGVIIDSPIGVIAAHEQSTGLPRGAIGRNVVARGEAGAWAALERGELEVDAFVIRFAQELASDGLDVDVAALFAAVDTLALRPVVLDAVRRARSLVKTGLLTNNWRQPGMLSALDVLRPEFDVVVESYIEGVRKPDPRIFEIACERLDVAPSEVVFLDDLGVNLKSARALGMTTIKVEDAAAAVAELDEVLARAAAR